MTGPLPASAGGASRGARLIIVGTVVAGIIGYVVTYLVFRLIGPAGYAVFASFWAAMYLVIGGISGIQQEITRATHPVEPGHIRASPRARNFAIAAVLVVIALVLGSSPMWSRLAFPHDSSQLVWPLVVGTSAYVLVATLTGSLYGVSQWRSIFLMTVADGVFRLVLILVFFTFTRDVVWIAWAAALPFLLVVLVLWRFIRSGLVGKSEIDVGYRSLVWNVLRTVLASVSTAVLISGFPLLVTIAGQSASQVLVGHLIFAVTITRAPLIVTVMALQSLLIVRFRDHGRAIGASLGTVLGLLLGGGIALAALATLIGGPILDWLSGGPTGLGGIFMGILVVSSALVAALTIGGAAVLARSRHFVYSIGWVTAAIVTIVIMALGLPFIDRIEFALLVGPASGLLVFVVWLLSDTVRARKRVERISAKNDARLARGGSDGR